jgi:hypothetical protein
MQAWLRADEPECPVPGDNHFKLPWTGPFTILAVTSSTATFKLDLHAREALALAVLYVPF